MVIEAHSLIILTYIINENKIHTSGNRLNAITDHKSIFTLVDSIKYNDQPPKFIKTEVKVVMVN